MDSIIILVLIFIVFSLLTQSTEQKGGRHRRNRNGRRDYYGYWGNYYNIFNPWRIRNPCSYYANKKCRNNYYYEPCYESKYFNCMNNTFYA